MIKEFGGFKLKDALRSRLAARPKGGLALGSLGAFLVIEERGHADARGAKRMARLTAVLSDRCNRQPGEVTATLERMWQKIAGTACRGTPRRDFRRDRRRAGDGGGARLFRAAPGSPGSRHRDLHRAWRRAAISP